MIGTILGRGEVNTTKRLYESMYVIDANLTDDQVDSIIAKYTKLVADQGGEVRAVGRWDKRRMAYEVKGRREGLYILMFFEAEPNVTRELDRVYRISDDVFRHLITRVEPEHVDTSRIDHPQPEAEAAQEAPEAVSEEASEEVAEQAPEQDTGQEQVTEQTEEQPASETPSDEDAQAEPVAEDAADGEQPEPATE